MVFAWSITEVVRYLFYALNLLGVEVYPVKWLRYSMFVVLYPLGVAGEVGCMRQAFEDGVLTTVTAASPYLITAVTKPLFTLVPFWVVIAVLWVGGLALLYSMMLGQRKKALGGKTRPSSSGKKTKKD